MNTTKTELLEEMQQKIATFVEGYDEDPNFNYQVDDLMNEIGEALDRYRDSMRLEEHNVPLKVYRQVEIQQTNNNTTKEL